MEQTMIKLQQMQDVINLFDSIKPEAQLPAQYYESTRYIRWSEFEAMQVYELDFEPYLSIAERCNMRFFALHQSPKRVYLAHLNDAGHAPRWEARPLLLSQLRDTELMTSLMQDHAYQLGLKINLEANYPI
ncbi:hypothetical protein N5C36_00975 [Shewanella xiamenensis]|nr:MULTISPECIES: hypothetical protein [Shewanella]MCT8870856.1 hypothetical protein [Shewanella xiamenensis]MDH1312668.1 hypothetical protein [Shewanella xiamenensis]NSM24719.1 hypothetical protein [Shewanella sp. ZOR0012]ODR86955.1 hypothetical protein ABT47_17555 [Shewanella xiamenensis]TVL15323.1 hypothetical protein AYI90_16450 [Shewanella xiamenensis]